MNTIINKIKDDEIINTILKNAPDAQIYLVGGAIRDFLLGKPNYDKDLIVENASDFAKNLAKSLDAKFLTLDEENKIYRIILNDKINYIDVAEPLCGDLEIDLKRRDLTINSIAVNLKTFEIIDINNGLEDLKNKKIKHISQTNIIDDPLRILRAFRFMANLGFEMDKDLEKIIKTHSKLTLKPAMERINYELLKLFGGDYCADTLAKMDELGVLIEIFPIITELKKVPSNAHHHLALFEHSIETVRQIENIIAPNPLHPEFIIINPFLSKIEFGGHSKLAHLKLAGFLHDIGKPQTWEIIDGKHRFIKHDDVGSKLAIEFLKKLKLSKKQISYITKMIKYHIYPSNVVAAQNPNEKIFMRFVRKIEADGVDIITLAMADRLSARGAEITDEVIEKNIGGLQNLLEFYISAQETIKPLPKLLNGLEVMEILNLQPSKELGKIMKALHEAQVSGEVLTKEGATHFVRNSFQHLAGGETVN